MKVVSLICQKGGTSKTTTAINLAVEAESCGLQVALIDLDPQVSACDWKDIRGDKPPVVAATPVPHLERALKAAEGGGADLAIIDTAGRTNDAAMAHRIRALRNHGQEERYIHAEVGYTPSLKFSAFVNLWLQHSTATGVTKLNPRLALVFRPDSSDIIRLAGGKPARALLTRVRAVGTRHEDTTAWLQSQGIEVCPAVLGERVTYQDAYAQGLSVSEAEPSGKAAEEIRQVYLYTCQLVGLPTRRMDGREEARGARKRTA